MRTVKFIILAVPLAVVFAIGFSSMLLAWPFNVLSDKCRDWFESMWNGQ